MCAWRNRCAANWYGYSSTGPPGTAIDAGSGLRRLSFTSQIKNDKFARSCKRLRRISSQMAYRSFLKLRYAIYWIQPRSELFLWFWAISHMAIIISSPTKPSIDTARCTAFIYILKYLIPEYGRPGTGIGPVGGPQARHWGAPSP